MPRFPHKSSRTPLHAVLHSARKPRLLVSVRTASEALAALAGGADVIDVKEPIRGSLGRADPTTLNEVLHAVNGSVPVTAALGELADFDPSTVVPVPNGICLIKIGLSRCGTLFAWPKLWQQAISAYSRGAYSVGSRVAAVAYADWGAANAPKPHEVLQRAIELSCRTLLIDTWNKTGGTLFDHWLASDLASFVQLARSQSVIVALAGSLAIDDVLRAAQIRPDLIAVRTAACDGGRNGAVSTQRVRFLKATISRATALAREQNISLESASKTKFA